MSKNEENLAVPDVYPYMWSWMCPICEMQGDEYDDEEFARQEARDHNHEDWS